MHPKKLALLCLTALLFLCCVLSPLEPAKEVEPIACK